MITTSEKKQTTIAKFSKDEFGTIAVSVHDQLLCLQTLEGNEEIGKQLNADAEIIEKPKILLEFHKEESIEVMIKALEKIRFNIRHPHGCLALAC